jgi:two-component system chemotaxis response regulator CheB
MATISKYKAIVMGTSAGGLGVLSSIVSGLPADFALPVIVVQHRHKDQRTLLEEILQAKSNIVVKQADDKEPIAAGIVYIAPPDYHLLVENDHTFSLTFDPHVSHSRPSIDVLFETAAAVYKSSLIGVLLTGANRDGTSGMKAIKSMGGLTIAQSPLDADYPYMPQAAIDSGCIDLVLTLKDIQQFLLETNK